MAAHTHLLTLRLAIRKVDPELASQLSHAANYILQIEEQLQKNNAALLAYVKAQNSYIENTEKEIERLRKDLRNALVRNARLTSKPRKVTVPS